MYHLVILLIALWTSPSWAHPLHSSHHTVTSGDTLYSIARHYGHSVSEIARWNHLSSPFHVKPGQRLLVSDPSAFKEIRQLWKSLGQTSNHCPELSDSFPKGGLRIFYCHVKTLLDYEKIQKLAGVPIFLQGPHQNEKLQLNASDQFGYYNPDFVKWLTNYLIPAIEDPSFREATQKIYEQFVEPLAQTYYVVHEHLVKHPDFLKKEQDAYLEAIRSQRLDKNYYEKYFSFSTLHQQGFDGRLVQTSVAFWIRRFIDGTEREFFTGLTTLMNTYGSQLANKTSHLLWTSTSPIHPKLPNFTFKFFGENQKEMVLIDQIRIYDQDDHEIQVIDNLNAQTPIGEAFQIEDMNFDGYLDFRLIEFLPMTPNIPYLFWLFDPKTREFVRNLDLQKMTFPEFDANKKLIISSWKDQGHASGTDYYQWIENKPVLVRQVLQEYSGYGLYQQTIKERVGEDIKVVEQKTVDERTPQTLSVENLVREVWQKLDPAQSPSCTTTQKGLNGFYACYLQKVVSLSQLQNLAQVPIFLQGPHQENHLHLKSLNEFGHYNKAFITWLGHHFIPAAQDEAFKKLTQPVYDQSISRLARIFYWTHESLFTGENPQHFSVSEHYRRLQAQHHFPFAKEEVIEAIGFWLRRKQDGTETEFFTHLRTLLSIYDLDFALQYAQSTQLGDYQTSIYPKPPEFQFKWLGNEFPNHPKQIKKIAIYKSGQLIQTIEGFETSHIPLIEDINFDDYQDLRLTTEKGLAYYWLFDRKTEQFVRNAELERIPMPKFDANKQEIQSSWKQGERFYGTNYYRYMRDTTPILFRQELYQVMGTHSSLIVKTLLERKGQDLEVIEQKLIE